MGSGLSVLERLSLDIQHASRAVVRSMYGERVKNVDPEILDHIAGKFYDRAGPQAMMAVPRRGRSGRAGPSRPEDARARRVVRAHARRAGTHRSSLGRPGHSATVK